MKIEGVGEQSNLDDTQTTKKKADDLWEELTAKQEKKIANIKLRIKNRILAVALVVQRKNLQIPKVN